MAMNPFVFGRGLRSAGDPYMLVIGMTGVRMGDRFAQIGCADGGRLAAIAGKVGLSGSASAIVPDESSASRARKGAAQAGVLVDVGIAPPTKLPMDDGALDVVVVDETGGLIGKLSEPDRAAAVREIARVLRPGGRVVFVSAAPRSGLSSLLSRASSAPPFAAGPPLAAGGFKSVRTLAEREGLVFVEGVKPR